MLLRTRLLDLHDLTLLFLQQFFDEFVLNGLQIGCFLPLSPRFLCKFHQLFLIVLVETVDAELSLGSDVARTGHSGWVLWVVAVLGEDLVRSFQPHHVLLLAPSIPLRSVLFLSDRKNPEDIRGNLKLGGGRDHVL